MSILDPSYMIDLGGIDVIQSQGVAISGLYQKLLDNIGPCGNPLIYNWKFNGIFIPPQYIEPVLEEGEIFINDISVSSDDVLHIPSIEIPPRIVQLNVLENGEYPVIEGIDGYGPVVANVQPNISLLNVTQNGTYEVPEGVDGYNPVVVNVSDVPILPQEYQEVEYIESTGTQYTTPFIVTLPLRALVVTRFARMSGTNEQAAFGSHSNATFANGTLEIGIANGASSAGVTAWSNGQVWQKYENGTTGNPCSATVGVTNNLADNYVTLCKYKTYMLNGRLYSCSIYKLKDTLPTNPYELMFKAVPCYRKADGVIGFYELVSGTFLTNAGTGSFGKGPDVNSVD